MTDTTELPGVERRDDPVEAEDVRSNEDASNVHGAAGKPKRERSTVSFPYDDLAAAELLARTIKDHYGTNCTADQLAAKLNLSPTSGSFRLKVSAGRIFGLLGGSGAEVELTDLGERLLSGDKSARVEAFLSVPLYKQMYDRFLGRTLPAENGLEATMRETGVTPKQTRTARQVFARSAAQAGFFEHGNTRLVMPSTLGSNGGTLPKSKGDEDDAPKPPKPASIMSHPLIQGLLAVLPEPGSAFPEQQKALWLKTLDMNLSFIYPPSPEQSESSTQAERTPEPNA